MEVVNTYQFSEQCVLYYEAAACLKYESGTKNQFISEQ